jgi:hypothetical protein
MFKNVKKCLKQFWLIAKFEVQTVVRLFFLKTCVFFSKIQNSKNNGDYIILFSLTLNHLFQQQFSIIISTENEKFHILRCRKVVFL